MSSPSRTKRLLTPLLRRNSDVVYTRDRAVLLPIRNVLRSIHLDQTSMKGIFRPAWSVTDLLFMQPSPGIDGFILYHRYSTGPDFYGDLDEQAQSDTLCALIEEHTIPFLRSVDSFETYYRLRIHCLQPIASWPAMHFRLELALGHFEIAHYLVSKHRSEWFANPEFSKTQSLVSLLEKHDHAGIAALLHEWEAITAKNFKIEHLWEPTPFPFETA
ncbi:hypothetical protein FQ775_06900 [Nitratireductor mangrovi]|uniref:Uncharacterized protein n=2 Tax=Nitratireductor mangrovi TaxID=2599600 RepID=A0A5B8KX78_9HYPH|nr:hypothetical protein FQ775_06900 [Nitratireductor mangrovi]